MASARLPLAVATVLLLLFCWASPGISVAQNPPAPVPAPDPAPEQTAETTAANEDNGQDRGRRGRPGRDGIKSYDEVITDEARTDDGVFTVHRLDDKVFYENPRGRARQGVPLGQPDRPHDGGGRLRRSGAWQPRRQVGPARRPGPAEERLLRDSGGCRAAHRAGRRSGQQRHDHQGVRHRGAVGGRCAGHRRDHAVQPRGPGVQRPFAAAGPRLRPRPVVHRERDGLPREHRGEDHAHLHRPAAVGVEPESFADPVPAARHAPRQRHRSTALQHGEAARRADAAAPVRRAGRLLLPSGRSTTDATSTARRAAATSRGGAWRSRT